MDTKNLIFMAIVVIAGLVISMLYSRFVKKKDWSCLLPKVLR